MPASSVECNAGNIAIGQGEHATATTGLTVEETIRGIEKCNFSMVLKNVELDQAYGDLLGTCGQKFVSLRV
ncbi:MAG: hypothetical protein NXI22_09815 [bacterium]|nr:hypothetical protein [bacterium]